MEHSRPTGACSSLTEAVVNKCTYKVTVGFDLPVDSFVGTIHTLNVQNYVNGKGTTGATCSLWSYDGNGNGALGTLATFNPNGAQTLTFTSAPSGNNMALLCTIPAGAGISAISWNPQILEETADPIVDHRPMHDPAKK